MASRFALSLVAGLVLGALGCGSSKESTDDAPIDAEPSTDSNANPRDDSAAADAIDAIDPTDTAVSIDAPAPDAPPPPKADVTIAGGQLLRNGSKFRPKGVSLIGLAATPKFATDNPSTVWAKSQKLATTGLDAELARFKTWGVDTIRFQVSQDGLDPDHTRHDATYLPMIINIIERTADAGFTVIVSMRSTLPSESYGDPCPTKDLPCAVTRRAWRQLLNDKAVIGSDRRFILEVYNEPLSGADNTAANWQAWLDEHQPLVDSVRMSGSKNVLIADGIRSGKFAPIAAKYELKDAQLAYGIHPYPLYIKGQIDYYRWSDWVAAFGTFCGASPHVCVATEWSTSSENSCYDQESAGMFTPDLAPAILRFLQAHNMGSVAWPGDYPSAVISDYAGTLTSFGPRLAFQCSPAGTNLFLGMGTYLKNYYLTGALP